MQPMELLALRAWSESSNEGVLVLDMDGTVCLSNLRLRELLNLAAPPRTLDDLVRAVDHAPPDLQSLFTPGARPRHTHWGTLQVGGKIPRRVIWQRVPLARRDAVHGCLIIFRDATAEGQLDLAKKSFLSMVSHDLRTPLSTILGFAELLYYNRSTLSDAEQTEFIEHIITNANALNRYTQIALDILFLEADHLQFETETVCLDAFVRHWLSDAMHRFSSEQIICNCAPDAPPRRAAIAPSAMHRILYILAEFALAEAPQGEPIEVSLRYEGDQGHIVLKHHAPSLSEDEAAAMFRLMHPRDFASSARPALHRMQLYAANLLAERQQSTLILHSDDERWYELDVAVPLVSQQAHDPVTQSPRR